MFFSVVIPLYNKELSIASTIDSVLNQTHRDFELIIVNDGSTDGSMPAVKAINDDRIRIVDKPNGGVSSARNKGIESARYDWIAFLDGDDLWQPRFLEEIGSMISDFPQAGIISTNYTGGYYKTGLEYDTRGYVKDYYGAVLEFGHIIWSSAVCVKKDCFAETGGFNENLRYGEDLDMWNRLVNSFILAYSPEKLSHYRLEAENSSEYKPIYPQEHWGTHIERPDSDMPNRIRYYKLIIDRYCARCIYKLDIKNISLIAKRRGVISLMQSIARIVLKRIRIYKY